jgi:hypothetical protein
MLSKKSFGGNKRNFLKLLLAQRRGGRHRTAEKRPRTFVSALRSIVVAGKSKITICEIFGVVRFSTFSTASALSGHIARTARISAVRGKADTADLRLATPSTLPIERQPTTQPRPCGCADSDLAGPHALMLRAPIRRQRLFVAAPALCAANSQTHQEPAENDEGWAVPGF